MDDIIEDLKEQIEELEQQVEDLQKENNTKDMKIREFERLLERIRKDEENIISDINYYV